MASCIPGYLDERQSSSRVYRNRDTSILSRRSPGRCRSSIVINNGITGASIVPPGWSRGQFREARNAFIQEAKTYLVDFDLYMGKTIDPRTQQAAVDVRRTTAPNAVAGSAMCMPVFRQYHSSIMVEFRTPVADFRVLDPAGRIVFQARKIRRAVTLPESARGGIYVFVADLEQTTERHTYTLP